MNNEIKKLIQQITGLAFLVSTTTEDDVFISYDGHSNVFNVGYSKGGWVKGNYSPEILNLYFSTISCESATEELKQAKLYLYELLEEEDNEQC